MTILSCISFWLLLCFVVMTCGTTPAVTAFPATTTTTASGLAPKPQLLMQKQQQQQQPSTVQGFLEEGRDDDVYKMVDALRAGTTGAPFSTLPTTTTTTTNSPHRYDNENNNNKNLDDSSLERNLQVNEYAPACADFNILYENHDQPVVGACGCSTEDPNADRIICLLHHVECNADQSQCTAYELDCNGGFCTQEIDVWFFDKGSGHLTSRRTCVACADEAGVCEQVIDICFHNTFDEQDEIDTCRVMLFQGNATAVCDECTPCVASDGGPGMDFDCFDGTLTTDNLDQDCLSDYRIGFHPFDELEAPTNSQIPSSGTGDASRNQVDKAEDSSSLSTAAIVAIALGALLLIACGLVTGLWLGKGRPGASQKEEIPTQGAGEAVQDPEITLNTDADIVYT